jgi:hypothetical protein
VSVLTGVSASNPELGGFRFIALHCGNDGPPLRAPYLLGSDTNCGQGDKLRTAPTRPPSCTTREVSNLHI